MDSVIRGHYAYKYFIDRALGKDFTGTALFAASVAELGIECARGLSGSGRILSIFSSLEVSIHLKDFRSAITAKLLVIKE